MSEYGPWLTAALIVLYLVVQAQVRRLESRIEALERRAGADRDGGRD